jgi:N-acetylgalactosamine-6-sulfatase
MSALRLFLGLLGLLCALAPARAQTAKPNILFILADDLGWGDLSCYGHPRLKTPNIDRLAAEGTLFTQYYNAGSSCSPSRAGLLTGRFPARMRMHAALDRPEINAARSMPDWLTTSTPTLARTLRSAGYATAHFGKWHLGEFPGAPEPSAYGFDVARSINGTGPTWGSPGANFRATSTAAFADEALRFIADRGAQPWYVQIWTLLPHALLNPTRDQMLPYLEFSYRSSLRFKSPATTYFASVGAVDREVGRLLDALAQGGAAQNTIVIFSSDNGPESFDAPSAAHSAAGSAGPFRGKKRSLYEGGIRAPFLVRWPGRVPAGRVEKSAVIAGVDFFPTLCALTGTPLPAGFAGDGENAAAAWRGQAWTRTKPLFWEYRFTQLDAPYHRSPILASREGNWKLHLNPDGSRLELYDLAQDPAQTDNVAAQNSGVVSGMKQRLLDWHATLPPGTYDSAAGRADYPMPGGP